MSEFQYYEFQTVDSRLSEKQMNELGDISTRAEITPYSFTNTYSWGNLKADPDEWMEKYFDGFLYYSNWGTRILKLRIPTYLLDFESIKPYFIGDYFSGYIFQHHIILSVLSEHEGGDCEENLSLAPFLALREDLLRGDFRWLYLAWLAGIQCQDIKDDTLEPPIPLGLDNLNRALELFSNLLLIDSDLLEVAAKKSSTLKKATFELPLLQQWIIGLPLKEKESHLVDILQGSLGNDQTAALLLARRFRDEYLSARTSKEDLSDRRTVAQLLEEARHISERHEKLEAEKERKEHEREQQEAQLAKEKRLDGMMGHESRIWNQIEYLASEKKASSYNKAVELILILRDLAARTNSNDFQEKLSALKQRHSTKRTLIERLSLISSQNSLNLF